MTDTIYLIWSFEHQSWWAPDEWGYTDNMAMAGRYSLGRAVEICLKANINMANEAIVPLPTGHRR
jgi:hypothetical protein